MYEEAIAARPGFDDVLLYNDRGEVTESTIANLVVEIGGVLLTPPVSSGLLPGTLRAHLLDEGRIREKAITVQEMRRRAEPAILLNSVRGFHPVSVAYRSVSRCSVLATVYRTQIAISGPKRPIASGHRSRCTAARGRVCRQIHGAFRRPSFQRWAWRPAA